MKVFFLIINCLFAALTAHPVCPSEADANWNLQGHIRISILCLISAGNRRKFTSVFNCASLAHPVPDEILRALVQIPIMHPYSDGQTGRDVKHWKDYFNIERKNTFLERSHFSSLLLPDTGVNLCLYFSLCP